MKLGPHKTLERRYF